MKRETAGVMVVGGGLAGLTAGLCLARRGVHVTLFEKAAALGGRARTHERDGFHFNLGPHALYRGGAGMAVLGDLQIRVEGRTPPPSGGYAVDGGRMHTLPVGIASLVATGLLPLRDKAALAQVLARLSREDARDPRTVHTSLAQWLEGLRVPPRVRQVIEALVRLTTYGTDVERLSAAAAIQQLQTAQRAGVLYLHRGWQSLVDRLAEAARDAGVQIVGGARVAAVERGPGVSAVRLHDGTRYAAQAVIVAAGPADAAALVEAAERTSLVQWAHDAAPVFVASLDLALRHLPRPRALFAVGIDRPMYFSVHSATAQLAPDGRALVHAAMYLGSEAAVDRHSVRREIEALVDLVQPGWRDAVVRARFLPHLRVAHDLPAAAHGGLTGRPGPQVPEVPGLFVAGDWVGPRGMLADASLASAHAAAEAAWAHVRKTVRAA